MAKRLPRMARSSATAAVTVAATAATKKRKKTKAKRSATSGPTTKPRQRSSRRLQGLGPEFSEVGDMLAEVTDFGAYNKAKAEDFPPSGTATPPPPPRPQKRRFWRSGVLAVAAAACADVAIASILDYPEATTYHL